MDFFRGVWQNNYYRLIITLIFCYILFNAFGSPLDRFDYILIIYILTLSRINEENALSHALLFGLAYDFTYTIFMGLGILLFQLLNLFKIYMKNMVDMTKFIFHIAVSLAIMLLYLMLTLKFCGYPSDIYWASLLMHIKYNLAAIFILTLISGGRSVSHTKR